MRDRNVWRDPGKPRRYITDKACKMKSRFTDEPQARAAALVAIETPRTNGKPVQRLWVYRCNHCSGWHMTSSPHDRRWLVEREKNAA